MCSVGCVKNLINITGVSDACECIGGSNNGRSCSSYDIMCQHFSPLMLSAISALILVVYGSVLQLFSSCGCLQGNEFLQIYCSCFKTAAEELGAYTMLLFIGIYFNFHHYYFLSLSLLLLSLFH